MNTYEMKTTDTEVMIYRISENGQMREKEKIAKIDLETGELMPIGRTKIAGTELPETSAPESKFPTNAVILILIFLVVVIGFFAFYQAMQPEGQTDLYFVLGFTSLTATVISIVFYIKWLIHKDESETVDSLEDQNFSESVENSGAVADNVQRMIITSENDSYFLLLDGESVGPFTYEQIKKSEIPNNVQMTTDKLGDWFPASQFELLVGIAFEPKDPSGPIGKGDYQITKEGFIKWLNK